MILVSIDDHVIEPPDMFERHLPEPYRDRGPRAAAGGALGERGVTRRTATRARP
jgi:hypothetical protein